MTKRRLRNGLLLCSLLVFLLAGCFRKPDAVRIPLESGWMWTVDNETPESFVPLSKGDLNHLEKFVPGGSGYIWLKYRFDLPSALVGVDLSCFLGRIAMADRTWLNGVFIGGEGSGAKDGFSEWNTCRLYPVPFVALETDSPNILLVQIRVDREGSIVSAPFIGAREEARSAALIETFLHSTVYLLVAAILAIMALYHFLLYSRRRSEPENLTFALLSLLTAVFVSNFFVTELPGMPPAGWSFLWFQKIIVNALFFFLVYLLCSFIRRFLGRKKHLPITVVRITCCVLPMLSVFLAPDYGTLRAMRGWTELFILPPLAYLLYLALSSLRRKNREAVPLLWVLFPLMLAALWDITVHEGLRLDALPYMSGLGLQLAVFLLFFILARRFGKARNATEELNRYLEKKAGERAAELSRLNQTLKTITDDLEDERTKAAGDLRLAANVQRSFLASKPPVVNGWEIAFAHQSLSAVSGDLYDFYAEGGELRGLSLFDVSGRGLASGLVALLAKSIFDRQFTDGRNTRISALLSSVDKTIVGEKGDIENYLTGILLRVRENRIEYVNAGHPDLLYRYGKSGAVRPVTLEGKDVKGRMLGIDGLSDGYTAIGFPMQGGDSLLLHTGSLSGARNGLGEEFGIERIKSAFVAAEAGSAGAKLDCLMDAFRSFVGNVPLNDDLTVVLLLRTEK